MNLYYELADSVIPDYGSKYLTSPLPTSLSHHWTRNNFQLASMADRVWLESNNTVRFVKNRYENLYKPDGVAINMEEFMWIKLQCKSI